jgi:two-component SAPR family response regulator
MLPPEDGVLDLRSIARIQHDLEGTLKLETVRVMVLGGFTVRIGSWVIQEGECHLKKAANLVKLLALAEEHRLHRNRATDLLCPDLGRKSAANNLYYALYVARRLLEKEVAVSSYLKLRNEWIGLCPDRSL